MFNKGDRVKCIDADNFSGLKKGATYTVHCRSGDYTFLEELVGGWFNSRFVLVKAAAPAVTPETLLAPQNRSILKHLKRTGTITQREALMDHSVQSLTKRISELRQAGYVINKENKKHPITGQRYARYVYAGA